MKTSELIRIFDDTQQSIRNDEQIQELTIKTITTTKLYKESFFSRKNAELRDKCVVDVTESLSFE